jgi:hypothetical protein
LEADEIMVKPEAGRLAERLDDKISTRKPAAQPDKERVTPLLHPRTNDIVEDWLANVKKSNELNYVALSDEERTGNLSQLIEDLIVRLKAFHIP